MKPTNEFARHLADVFRLFGPIELRRMFGGYGVYHDGLMFGLVAGEALYLKADAGNVAQFQEEGLPPFEYRRKGRVARLSYYLAPALVLEDSVQAACWARRSFDAALRGRARKA